MKCKFLSWVRWKSMCPNESLTAIEEMESRVSKSILWCKAPSPRNLPIRGSVRCSPDRIGAGLPISIAKLISSVCVSGIWNPSRSHDGDLTSEALVTGSLPLSRLESCSPIFLLCGTGSDVFLVDLEVFSFEDWASRLCLERVSRDTCSRSTSTLRFCWDESVLGRGGVGGLAPCIASSPPLRGTALGGLGSTELNACWRAANFALRRSMKLMSTRIKEKD